MKLYHGTAQRNVNSIITEGFFSSDSSDMQELKEKMGGGLVFFSDKKELCDGYQAILECEVTDAYMVGGRQLIDNEYVAHPDNIVALKVYFEDGEEIEL